MMRPLKNIVQLRFIDDNWAASWENQQFAYAKTKTQISFAVTAKLISVFVFARMEALYICSHVWIETFKYQPVLYAP